MAEQEQNSAFHGKSSSKFSEFYYPTKEFPESTPNSVTSPDQLLSLHASQSNIKSKRREYKKATDDDVENKHTTSCGSSEE